MNSSKEKILNRIRDALGRDNERVKIEIDRSYEQNSTIEKEEIVHLFTERMGEYKAVVEQITETEISNRVHSICENAHIKKLVVPSGLNEEWLSGLTSTVSLLKDSPEPLSKTELNDSDAVLTGCFLGVAQTGTIILNAGPGQGRRMLTLLPDFHICIIHRNQIVELIPEAVKKLQESVVADGAPVTFISGPSATSDIELKRVEGVHGPRKLHVLIITKS